MKNKFIKNNYLILSVMFFGTLLSSCGGNDIPITYEVSIHNSDGGMIYASTTKCFANETIEIKVVPSENYELKYIYINDENLINDVVNNFLYLKVVEDIDITTVFGLKGANLIDLSSIFSNENYDKTSKNINEFSYLKTTQDSTYKITSFDGKFYLNGSGEKNNAVLISKKESNSIEDSFYSYNTISNNFTLIRSNNGVISTLFSDYDEISDYDPEIFYGSNYETTAISKNFGVENAILNLFNFAKEPSIKDFISYELGNNKYYFEFKISNETAINFIRCLFEFNDENNENIIKYNINDSSYKKDETNFSPNTVVKMVSYDGNQAIGEREEQKLYDFNDFAFGNQEDDVDLSFIDKDKFEITSKFKAKKGEEVYAKLNFSNPLYGSFLIDFPSITSVNSRSFEVSNNKMSKKIGLKFNESGEDTIEFTFNKGLKKSVKIFVE